MASAVLATKLYLPPLRQKTVLRERLVAQLDECLHSKLALISAPAGFGKTTLVSEWIHQAHAAGAPSHPIPTAWLSLDEGDSEPTRFLSYFVAALQTVAAGLGASISRALESPQPPQVEAILTALLNEITTLPDDFVLVLDDYHAVDAKPVDDALTFMLEHLPPRMHLVIATREDPQLPLARLRAQGELVELRATDLRFTPAEAAEFLNRGMGLSLSAENVDALEARTEGWVAGLQLAALSMQGHVDAAGFIQSFTGSHRYVLDYLLEEVLRRQPEEIQQFLLHTSILDRMCAPLCDILLSGHDSSSTLASLERSNLFIVPLDGERRWYRYHHLFADLLRQRLRQGEAEQDIAGLHVRASQWHEEHGLPLEAFQHAAAAGDVARAERLIIAGNMPLYYRGAVMPVLNWLGALPKAVRDARPVLWVRSAALTVVIGQTIGVEETLQSAEAALQNYPDAGQARNLTGEIAAVRATLALTQYRLQDILIQSRRALEYLDADDLAFRMTALWTLGNAYHFLGERAAAVRAFSEAISICEEAGDVFHNILSSIGLGNVQLSENELHPAAETFRRVLRMASDQPLQIISEAHLGLAGVLYEWNDMDAAEQHARSGYELARQYESVIDRFVLTELLLARVSLARGDVVGAAATVAEADRAVRQNHFALRAADVAAARARILLRQGDLEGAAALAQAYDLPLAQARVLLAQGDPAAALARLAPYLRQAEAKGLKDELLKATVLQALAADLNGERAAALALLDEALAMAEPGGFTRTFVDEGAPMARLLAAATQGARAEYAGKLLADFETGRSPAPDGQPLVEPLSARELEILGLVAQGLSNRQIGERLYLALDTVKGYNRRIFEKLQVERRTEAIARARELGILSE